MIRAQDIRFGNLVSVKGCLAHVISINKNSVWVEFLVSEDERSDTLEIDLSRVDPVALTEQRLLEFGFGKCEIPHTYWKFPIELLAGLDETEWIFEGFDTKIQYAHHLQNIFRDLSGQELTLNPQP